MLSGIALLLADEGEDLDVDADLLAAEIADEQEEDPSGAS